MQLIDKVAQFYEKHPFPALPWHAPLSMGIRVDDLPLLNYYAGYASTYGHLVGAAKQPNILVAGCGTFEPIAVAMANPGACITAIDISASSLRKLERLARWKSVPLNLECKSLLDVQGQYDYVVSTGVLHHLPDPEAGLRALVAASAPAAVFRLMVYSAHGRELLYGAKQLAVLAGADTPKKFRTLMESLPDRHPYKIYFCLYTDARSDAGLADGYLHPCDQPFTAPSLQKMLINCGLNVGKFLLKRAGNPDFCEGENWAALSRWQKLEALDLLGDLEENFIFFAGREQVGPTTMKKLSWNPALPKKGSLYSKLVDKTLSFNRAELPPSGLEWLQSLYVLPGDLP